MRVCKFFLFLLCLTSLTYAQGNFSYGLGLSTETAAFLDLGDFDKRKDLSFQAYGFEGFVQYDLSDRIFVRGGLEYSLYREKVYAPGSFSFIPPLSPGDGGWIADFAPNTATLFMESSYVSIPVDIGLRLSPSTSSSRFFLGLGAVMHTKASFVSNVKSTNPDGEKTKHSMHSREPLPNGYAARLFVGWEKDISQKFSIAFEPYFEVTGDLYRYGNWRNNQSEFYDFGMKLRVIRK